MTQAFNLTADSIKPVAGMYAYVPNHPQLHNAVFTSSTATDVAVAGEFVKINGSATDKVVPSVVACAVTDIPFGMVVYDPRVASNKVGEKVALAKTGDIVYLVAGGAISAGAKLQFNATTHKVDDTSTSTNAYIGTAVTPASADGDLIQVELNFNLGVAS